MARDEMLRTYGVLPEMAVARDGPVRSQLTLGNTVGQWIAFLLFGVGLFVLGLVLVARVANLETGLTLGGISCACGVLFGYVTARGANQWVELDGDTFRWKHLFTRRTSERDIQDIESIVTLLRHRGAMIDELMTHRIMAKIFGRIRGFEFRFLGMKQRVQISRADPAMTNVRELLEAVLAKMCQAGTVVPEAIDVDGTPLVRKLTLERN